MSWHGPSLRKNMGKSMTLKDHIFAINYSGTQVFDVNDRCHYDLAREITNRAILTLLKAEINLLKMLLYTSISKIPI